MLRHLVKLLTWGGLASAVLGVVFVAGFLQEFARDELKTQSIAPMPLKEPRIQVSLQRMTLSLFEGDTLVKRYNIGYGKGPPARVTNRHGGTPIGEYRIIAKEKRKDIFSHGSRFLRLDFPSVEDANSAYDVDALSAEERREILDAHRDLIAPPVDTSLGGPIGIQGNFFFFMDRRFTEGSVALSNGDINELYEHVPIGTSVVIEL